jgi:hypothetical protein
MSTFRTADRSDQLKINGLRLRKSGTVPPTPSAPSFVAAGTAIAGTTGALTVVWPALTSSGDLGILVHETSGGSASISAPSGWVAFTGSPVVDIADATGSKLSVFWRFAQSNAEANVTTTGVADHSLARIYVFRGVRPSIAPGRAATTDTKLVAAPSITWPSISALAHNSRILYIASRPDDSSATNVFSFFTNANLINTAALGEAGTVSGNGGGFGAFWGTKETPGAAGTATANLSASVTNAMMVLGLEPTNELPA